MEAGAVVFTVITKILGVALIVSALLAVTGRLLPQNVPADDIAAFLLVTVVEGTLYSLPQRWFLASRRHMMLYLATTGFAPFLVVLAAVQYGFQEMGTPTQRAANLVTAGVVFLLALCPLAAMVSAHRRLQRTAKQGGQDGVLAP